MELIKEVNIKPIANTKTVYTHHAFITEDEFLRLLAAKETAAHTIDDMGGEETAAVTPQTPDQTGCDII